MLNHIKSYVLYPCAEQLEKRDIRTKLSKLRGDYNLSKSEREFRKQKQLHKVLSYSKQNIPYYKDLFQQIQFNPDDILKDISFIKEIPFITKAIILEQGSRLVSNEYDLNKLHKRFTSGSTGENTTIFYDTEALDWTAAVNLFVQEFTGKRQVDKEVHLSTKHFNNLTFSEGFREKVKCWAMNRVNVYTSKSDDESLNRLLGDLERSNPYLVQGFPSTLYALAKYVERKNKKPSKRPFVAFEATGENIDSKKLSAIEKNLGCKVYNRYGNAELGVIAHSRSNANQLEIIDYIAHIESCALGNGLEELVVTNTTNFAMPLIRYKTGDIGEVLKDDSRDYIVNLYGRVHDMVRIGNETYSSHYIQDIMDEIGGVDEFQIIEHKNCSHTIKLVANDRTNKELISNRLTTILGNINIEFTQFDKLIKRGWRDKFCYVIREA